MGKKQSQEQINTPQPENFKLTRAKIKEMYNTDNGIRATLNKNLAASSSSIDTTTIDTISTNFYNIGNLDTVRKYSEELYTFYPIYSNLIEYFSTMYDWKYVYIPRQIKEKTKDYQEIYDLIGEVVDGLSIETLFPRLLSKKYVRGAVYITTVKNTSSKTISTIILPDKYCRPTNLTQFGTIAFQFDYSYFDSLNMSAQELEQIWPFYPPEMYEGYKNYKTNTNLYRWQLLNPKTSAGFTCNDYGFPTKLKSIFSIKQYDQYLNNELTRNNQQLDKIISHEMPTWQDRLIVDVDEMTELHQSMAKLLKTNEHVRLMTTFGKLSVHSIGEDESKENKVLENAYNAIYSNAGENNNLFTGSSVESLRYALAKDGAIIWKDIQQFVSFYNVVLNNTFNFGGYQCDFSILPITVYNRADMLINYKDAATLGVGKLEYIVASGVKQIDIPAKIELENFLQLDKLKPLSTSYTQKDNNQQEENPVDEESADEVDAANEPVENEQTQEDEVNNEEQEVQINE